MITMIVIALALGAIGLFYTAARNRGMQSRTALRPVDVQALRTLFDRDDEVFLREKLPDGRFRRIKRRRIRVTMKYVARVSGNASVVMRMGESARLSPDPEVAEAALQVLEIASQIRLQCLLAFAKLTAEFAVPSLQLTPATLVSRYQALRENVVRLGALETRSVTPATVAI